MLINTAFDFAKTAGLRIICAGILIAVGFKIIKILISVITKSLHFKKLDIGVQGFLKSFINILLKIIILVTAAAVIGVPMTSMVAVLGSAGLAIGLALQGSLSNIAGGIIILMFKPFSVGDYIDNGTYSGTVTGINIFYTRLLTPDNSRVVIPNGNLSNQSLINVSAEPTRRVDLSISVAYDSNIEEVKSILLSEADKHILVLKDPPPEARLILQGQSSLDFTFRCWCESKDFWTVKFDLIESTKNALDKAGISIPYPQVDVHMDSKNDSMK